MTSATSGMPAGGGAQGRPPLRDVVPQWPVTAGDVVAASSSGDADAHAPGRDAPTPSVPPARERRRPWRSRGPAVPAPPSPRPPARFRVVRLVAGLVAAVGLLVSVLLAAGALAVAVGVDPSTGWGERLATACDALAGPLRGLFDFSGEHGEARETLAAWGLGSVAALVGGRLAAWLVARLA
jgi:hypothetical protein